LEALHLLVGGLAALPHQGLVVVRDLGVEAEPDDRRLLLAQLPQEEMPQQSTEHPDPAPPEGVEQPLDMVRGGHPLRRRFDGPGVAFLLASPHRSAPGAGSSRPPGSRRVEETARGPEPLSTPTEWAKQPLQVPEDPHISDAAGEQGQTAASRQGVRRNLDFGERGRGTRGELALRRGLRHLLSSPVGLSAARAAVGVTCRYTNNLAQRVSCFQPPNRSS